jgi:hypothetical protein
MFIRNKEMKNKIRFLLNNLLRKSFSYISVKNRSEVSALKGGNLIKLSTKK